ncbi:NAD(P)H-dependent glycerol-3-phosphate dehydrogenase [Lapillicoccus sp.]|uniref:NAD(P)H-dependent glycerol-3-phosphate dehydrogenase n=1 Tax=Lapillicoccus sp. TaxID=1909287 RepID=UPI00398310DA
MTRATVLGTGSWGTAFAATMADAGTEVTMWARRREVVEQINRGTNEDYLAGIALPQGIRATTDAVEALAGADVVVLAVPSQTLRDNLAGWADLIPETAAVASLMKGIELGTTKRMSEVIAEVGRIQTQRIVVVSGPNLAREIAERHPAASVVACTDESTAEQVAAACATPWFRPYTHDDVIGIELGGAVKNVVALAVGMAEGMGMGDNSKASLITRGLAETARLGAALGADPATLMGLAGVGDLIATCMSPLSRNRTFGVNLGRGMRVEEVVTVTRQTAEGVKSCQSILQLARDHGVDMPIVEAVVGVVRSEVTPREMVTALMTRSLKSEGTQR